MDQLFPEPVANVDVSACYARDARPAHDGRPWVLANMIATIDGAIEVDGVSGGLGGPADKAVFSAIRAVADVIVVGAGTVEAENYREPQTSPAHQETRRARGQQPRPQIAIVTASVSISPDHRVFDADVPPVILTCRSAPSERVEALQQVAEVMAVGDDDVDLAAGLAALYETGARIVLLEGGPTLNGAMAAAGLIDEWCVSAAPMIVGGTGGRMIAGNNSDSPTPMTLVRTLHQDGYLFHRYVRESSDQPVT